MQSRVFWVSQMIDLASAHLNWKKSYEQVWRYIKGIKYGPSEEGEVARIQHRLAQYGLSQEPRIFNGDISAIRERYSEALYDAIHVRNAVREIESSRRELPKLRVDDTAITIVLENFASKFLRRRVEVLEGYARDGKTPPHFLGFDERIQSSCFGPPLAGRMDNVFSTDSGNIQIFELKVTDSNSYNEYIPGTDIPKSFLHVLQTGTYGEMARMERRKERKQVEALLYPVPYGPIIPVDLSGIPRFATNLAQGLVKLDSMTIDKVRKLDEHRMYPNPEFLTNWDGASNA